MKINHLTTKEENVAEAVKIGKKAENLNKVIQAYLDNYGISKTVAQWRIDNYAQLRRWAYPPPEELLDAQMKLNSGIDEIKNQGQRQLDNYVGQCLDVKTSFPKE